MFLSIPQLFQSFVALIPASLKHFVGIYFIVMYCFHMYIYQKGLVFTFYLIYIWQCFGSKGFSFRFLTQTLLHFASRLSCTQVTGPTRTTMSPWRVGSTSTQLTPRMAMPPSTWQGWSHLTRALTNVRWKRLLASAAGGCCWSSWVSANKPPHTLLQAEFSLCTVEMH